MSEAFQPHSYASPQRPTPLARPSAVITYTLIAVNVLVFVAMVASGVSATAPSPVDAVRWGAIFGPFVLQGQWWRLITCCFVHFGIAHIALNMYCLFQVGPFTEGLYGRGRYLALYVAAGLGGSVTSLLVHPQGVSAGASGAIFGVYGGLLAFLLLAKSVIARPAAAAIARSSAVFLGINLVYGLTDRSTDLSAHVGGLLIGFLAGCALTRGRIRRFVG